MFSSDDLVIPMYGPVAGKATHSLVIRCNLHVALVNFKKWGAALVEHSTKVIRSKSSNAKLKKCNK